LWNALRKKMRTVVQLEDVKKKDVVYMVHGAKQFNKLLLKPFTKDELNKLVINRRILYVPYVRKYYTVGPP